MIAGTFTNVQAQTDSTPVTIGQRQSIHSAVLHENRPYRVYLPAGYHNNTYLPARYPVIYLLDGDENFHSLTGIQAFLSKGPYAQLPEMIVVGISNVNRTRDLTPTSAKVSMLNGRKAAFEGSGGGTAFTAFLEKELIPHIEATYRTNGYRVLIGHSFGGLTTVNTLLQRPDLFQAYIAIDPSLWWDNSRLLNSADSLLQARSFKGRNLYVSLAHKEVTPQDTTTDHPRAIRRFFEVLKRQQQSGLRFATAYFEDEDHGSVPLVSELQGLRFIFKGHQQQVKAVAKNPSLLTVSYQALSQQLGFELKVPEAVADWLGNYCVSNKDLSNAYLFYKMNADAWPQSAHALRALAGVLQQQGKTAAAAAYLQQAAKNKAE